MCLVGDAELCIFTYKWTLGVYEVLWSKAVIFLLKFLLIIVYKGETFMCILLYNYAPAHIFSVLFIY